jgi:arylsulfatase
MQIRGRIFVAVFSILLATTGITSAQAPQTSAPVGTTVPRPQPAESLPRPNFSLQGPLGEGMIFTQGGITAGWGFYLQKGKLVGVHKYIGFERYRVVSSESVPTGKVTLTFDFKYDGGGMGKGGTITLLANGKKIGDGRVEKTTGLKYSLYEGQDSGSPVDFTYTAPFPFTGRLDKVTIELK